MTKNTISAIIITALIVSGIWWAVVSSNGGTESGNQNNKTGDQQPAVNKVETDSVRVEYPTINAIVQSPLVVRGEARGTWFFEASFPVKLVDANDNVLAQGYVMTAQDWMTTDFVQFESVALSFSGPATATGELILEKANPSGLPENAAEIRVPVRFY